MTVDKLDINTRNNDIGLYFGNSGRVTLDVAIGEMANWIKAGTAGDVVWSNSITGIIGVWNLEAGEPFPVECDQILSTGNVTATGVLETTGATNLFWASTPNNLGGN